MKKAFKIIGIVLLSILILLALALLGFKLVDRLRHKDFYKNATVECRVPGTYDGSVAQGFEYITEKETFLSTGYMNDGSASRVYVFKRDTKNPRFVSLLKEDGSDYTGHVGGITYAGEYVYIGGHNQVEVYRLSDFLDPEIKSAKRIGHFDSFDVSPAFVEVTNGILYAGSFYDEGHYDTDPMFHVKNRVGGENRATMLAFRLDSAMEYGVDAKAPVAAYSLPDCVQGVVFTGDGRIVLSTSYGLSTSRLFVHSLEKIAESPKEHYLPEHFGADINLYFIDDHSLLSTIYAPPMSEELVYLDKRIWILNESASDKYIFGRITSGENLYSINID